MPLTTKQIAEQNDEFRKRVLFKEQEDGVALITKTLIDELTSEEQFDTILTVKDFNDFNEDNDPYGTHESGSFTLGKHHIFWKIDLFKDEKCLSGLPIDSEDTGFRVLTVCFIDER